MWTSFRSQHRPNKGSFWKAGSPVDDKDADAFRLWIRSVFMPLNRQMMDLVVNRADLLEGTEIPRCLLEPATSSVGGKSRAVPRVCRGRIESNGEAPDVGEHSGCVALGPEAADYVGSHFWLSLVGGARIVWSPAPRSLALIRASAAARGSQPQSAFLGEPNRITLPSRSTSAPSC